MDGHRTRDQRRHGVGVENGSARLRQRARLAVAELRQARRARADARVGREHAVDVGEVLVHDAVRVEGDLAGVVGQGGGDEGGGHIRAAAREGGRGGGRGDAADAAEESGDDEAAAAPAPPADGSEALLEVELVAALGEDYESVGRVDELEARLVRHDHAVEVLATACRERSGY